MPRLTPLLKIIKKISAISTHEKEDGTTGVLEKIQILPDYIKDPLDKISKDFHKELKIIGWKDVADWIEYEIPSYKKGIEKLAKSLAEAREQPDIGSHAKIVMDWNIALRPQLDIQKWIHVLAERKILCAFSSAVDATYKLWDQSTLDALLNHAAEFVDKSQIDLNKKRDNLINNAYQNYKANPEDRKDVSSVEDAIAELMISYEKPTGYNKPLLKGNAKEWMRKFYIDIKPKTGIGGASLNIAEALAGLGSGVDVFWAYHSELLSGVPSPCLGTSPVKHLRRCWFDEEWNWKNSPFGEPGSHEDDTGCPHPIRMSIPISFNTDSPLITVPGVRQDLKPMGTGRIVYQFADPSYYSPDFFESPEASPGSWDSPPPLFCRWRWDNTSARFEYADENAMQNVVNKNYYRFILSGFQSKQEKIVSELAKQCKGLNIYHEISSKFKTREEVKEYYNAIKNVLDKAAVRTAGMNAEELQAFTSWHGTDVFVAVKSPWEESLLQRFLRAAEVREKLNLDWIYIHGNELDIVVLKPGFDESKYEEFRQAMLFAKVAVFAALHIRSGFDRVLPGFEPCFSAKGFLALYKFAEDFAQQFASSEEERKKLHLQILTKGYVYGRDSAQGIVVTPVYWPESLKGFSTTGAGDISSGIVATLAP